MTMSSRNRYFLIAAVLFLLVGTATGFVAFYVGLPAGFSRSAGPEELRYLPKEAAVVAYANVQVMMRSEVRRRMRSAALTENGQQEFKDRTGIDLEHDVDRIVACLEPHTGGETAALVLLRGRFDEKKIEALMRERGGEAEEYQGKRVVVAHPTGVPSDGFAVSFLDSGLVAVGGTGMVRQALDQIKGRVNVTDNTELMNLVRGLDPADAWVVGRFDVLRADAPLPPGLASQIPAVTWFTASGQVDSAIRGTIRADAKDDEAATNLRDAVRGLVGLAKLQGGSHPELRAVADSLQLGGTGKTIVLSFTVPAETIDALSQSRK